MAVCGRGLPCCLHHCSPSTSPKAGAEAPSETGECSCARMDVSFHLCWMLWIQDCILYLNVSQSFIEIYFKVIPNPTFWMVSPSYTSNSRHANIATKFDVDECGTLGLPYMQAAHEIKFSYYLKQHTKLMLL